LFEIRKKEKRKEALICLAGFALRVEA